MALKAFDLTKMQTQAAVKVDETITLTPLSFVLIANALVFLHEHQWLFVEQSEAVTDAIDTALSEVLLP